MNHLSGFAIDLTLVKGKKEFPLGGIDFSEKDHINYYEKKKNLTKKEETIRNNRRILKKVMRKSGFEVYAPEWWHWGYSK